MSSHPLTPSPPHPLIFLTGPRGSGKTTVARLLARRLGWEAVDADEALEARHGRSVRAVFAEEGEAGFREKEAAVLAELGRLRRHVVATGGGAVLRADNRELLRRCGWVVWLTAERRPALGVGGREEVVAVLRAREVHYRGCADLTVQTAGRTPEEVAEEILGAWARRGGAAE